MMRAYKFRMYPTDEQAEALSRQFGATRFVWNWALALIKANNEHIKLIRNSWGGDIQTLNPTDAMTMAFHGCQEPYDPAIHPFRLDATVCSLLLTPASRRKKDKLPDGLKTEPGLKDVHPWLSEVPDKILRYSLRNLGTAFKNFFKANKNGDHAGYPTFKKKRSNQSAQYQRENISFDEYSGLLSIPKVKGIEVRAHRRILGRIGTTTVSKSKTGKYFVSFQVDTGEDLPAERPIDESNVVGIDLGIICYAGTSDGQKISNPRPIKDCEDRLVVLSKRLSRKVEGSKNYEKARKKIAVVHEKVEHQRRDFQHKLSRGLVDNYDAIVIRPMDSQKMAQENPYFAKSIYDAGWFEFKRQLQYKAAWKGKAVIEVSKGLASTRTCSHCGYVMPKVGLDEREWQCPKCYHRHDREINAAINIRAAGIDQIRTAGI